MSSLIIRSKRTAISRLGKRNERQKQPTRTHLPTVNVNNAAEKTTTACRRANDHVVAIIRQVYNLRRWYYLSNVRRDRFALEIRNLPSYYPGYGTSSSQIVVTTFDVRFRSSFIDEDKRLRRKEIATIAAWSIFEDSFDENEKSKAELIQLGKTTLVKEQDCKLVRGLIKEANDLVCLTASTFLKIQDRFVASLYLEKEEKEEQDKDPVIEISFSNSHQFEHEGLAIQDHFGLTTVEHDAGLYNNERMYARLAHLAADTSILFHSRNRNIIAK